MPADVLRPVRVAVLAQHELVHAGLRAMLAPYAHRVCLVAAAPGARRLARAGTGTVRGDGGTDDVDVVLRDTVGPVDTPAAGPTVTPTGRARVVVFSWSTSPLDIERAFRAGASAYVAVSATAEELVAAVEHARAAPVRTYGCRSSALAADEVPGGWLGQAWGLSYREAQMLALIAEGRANEEIADLAHLSINTVKTYIRLSYRKIGVSTRPAAVLWALHHGFGSPPEQADGPLRLG